MDIVGIREIRFVELDLNNNDRRAYFPKECFTGKLFSICFLWLTNPSLPFTSKKVKIPTNSTVHLYGTDGKPVVNGVCWNAFTDVESYLKPINADIDWERSYIQFNEAYIQSSIDINEYIPIYLIGAEKIDEIRINSISSIDKPNPIRGAYFREICSPNIEKFEVVKIGLNTGRNASNAYCTIVTQDGRIYDRILPYSFYSFTDYNVSYRDAHLKYCIYPSKIDLDKSYWHNGNNTRPIKMNFCFFKKYGKDNK